MSFSFTSFFRIVTFFLIMSHLSLALSPQSHLNTETSSCRSISAQERSLARYLVKKAITQAQKKYKIENDHDVIVAIKNKDTVTLEHILKIKNQEAEDDSNEYQQQTQTYLKIKKERDKILSIIQSNGATFLDHILKEQSSDDKEHERRTLAYLKRKSRRDTIIMAIKENNITSLITEEQTFPPYLDSEKELKKEVSVTIFRETKKIDDEAYERQRDARIRAVVHQDIENERQIAENKRKKEEEIKRQKPSYLNQILERRRLHGPSALPQGPSTPAHPLTTSQRERRTHFRPAIPKKDKRGLSPSDLLQKKKSYGSSLKNFS